jgi:predicted NBD/HSP70 family sugar kinase
VSIVPEPPSRAGEVLRAVHRTPGIPRAELANRLGLSSGLASDLVARLVGAAWLSEGEPAAAAGRGRPTRTLWPHPDGPLVAAVAISHETWRIELCELGGGVVECEHDTHDRDRDAVLGAVRRGLEKMWGTYGPRIRGIAASAPGIVSGCRLVQAPNLGWEDVDFTPLLPPEAVAAGIELHVGNDANDSAVAELARGAAEGLSGVLVVFMDSGVGGALIDAGRVTQGAHGMSGEFGHLPLGSRRFRCRCGAAGCWNTELDGAALARLLNRPLPADEVTFTRGVFAAASEGGREEMRAARAVARALGRGTAGLVNACDPERVVFCGLAATMLSVAPESIDRAYVDGLMRTRAAAPPEIVAGALGDRAPLVGAMEEAFAPVLSQPAF